jgi:peptidoglycan/LPS O-acetylase OafA/YrhL
MQTPIFPPRYQILDHWRGLAALAVILKHTPLYTLGNDIPVLFRSTLIEIYHHGWWGVPVFFAISGYCVTAAADRTTNVLTYFARRVRRIYPPYLISTFLILLLWLPLGQFWSVGPNPIASPDSFNFWGVFGNLTLSCVWLSRALHEHIPFLNAIAWTLCYEEAYYLIVGLVLALAGRRWLIVGISAFTVAFTFLPRIGIDPSSTPADRFWYGFAAGVAAYFIVKERSTWIRSLYTVALLGATILLLARMKTNVDAGGAIGAVFACILVVLHPYDAKLSSLKILWPLQWCGQRCYSIYLVHWPVCKMLATIFHDLGWDEYAALWPLATIPASLLIGNLFYHGVEKRFLNNRTESSKEPLKLQIKEKREEKLCHLRKSA